MKAILVIDVPSDYGDIADNKAIVALRNDKLGTSLRIHNVPLKPMPQKNEIKNEEEFMNVCGWMFEVQTGMDIGWNDCIEEIENESKECV